MDGIVNRSPGKKPVGPLDILEQYDDGFGGTIRKDIVFPEKLITTDQWVSFRILQDHKLRREEAAKEETLRTIFLPLPMQLQTGYNASYNNESMGAIGSYGAGVGEMFRNASDLGDLSSKVLNEIKTANPEKIRKHVQDSLLNIGAEVIQSEVAATVGGFLGGGVTGGIIGYGASEFIKSAMGGAGIARNPHLALLFAGTDFRTHSFNYKFIPKNKNETDLLADLIFVFKYHQAPGLRNSDHFFDYPQQFDIDFSYPNYLFNVGTSVLTNFSIDYHAEGTPAYFESTTPDTPYDRAPFAVSISMQFQEVSITTKDTILRQNR